jgi:hypothetical protein
MRVERKGHGQWHAMHKDMSSVTGVKIKDKKPNLLQAIRTA